MKRVLVIDDDAALREAIELALEDLPCVVLAAASAEEGLTVQQQYPVDLVYLDLKMSGVDGVKTLRRLRALGCTAHVYIVTAFEDEFSMRLTEAKDEGLEFDVVQKPLERDQIREATTAVLGQAQSNDVPQSILVVDDDEAVRDAFKLALEDLPFTVLTAANGEEGLAVRQQQPVDLVYLDLKMPGIDGVETLRRLRAMGCTCRVYIVTGFADEFFIRLREAKDEGLDFELIRKPLERDQIREATAAVLGE